MKSCEVEECNKKVFCRNLCNTHYYKQLKVTSKNKTTKRPNEVIFEGNICRMFLYNRQNKKIGETIFDAEEYEKCKPFRWGIISIKLEWRQLYVANNYIGRLANIILRQKTNSKIHIDHINGNSLDNRKCNLQIITNQQNQLKKKKQKNNTSGYRGVFWYVNPGKTSAWEASIKFNHKGYFLGRFASKDDAALVYNKKAKELFGKFAVLNNIPNRKRGIKS